MGAEGPDRTLLRKITPSLVTLLAAEPEIQYVALRNINIIVDKYPGMLSHEVKVRLLDAARVPPCLEPASTRPLRRPPFGTAPLPAAAQESCLSSWLSKGTRLHTLVFTQVLPQCCRRSLPAQRAQLREAGEAGVRDQS